mmetsp:Transcript_148255/g.272369  ORF Transcript_148255/g.272369 Transcript_148255/m.272369 type:complete len:124 (+) Transcript_148255:312-683(+)
MHSKSHELAGFHTMHSTRFGVVQIKNLLKGGFSSSRVLLSPPAETGHGATCLERMATQMISSKSTQSTRNWSGIIEYVIMCAAGQNFHPAVKQLQAVALTFFHASQSERSLSISVKIVKALLM